MRIHFIGIGGNAAAYLVELARRNGDEVSGSDAVASTNTEHLIQKRVNVTIPHNPELISRDLDEVWYSAAITTQSLGYSELDKARQLGIPTINFAEAAARFFNAAATRVAVAGTHGKSTTTAMVGWILEKAGQHPTVALGAEMHAWNGGALVGNPELFVIEADEYAKRFLEYQPTHAIITNVEPDHFDTFPTEEDLIRAFTRFAESVEDCLVVNGMDERVHQATEQFSGRKIVYGLGGTVDHLDIWAEVSKDAVRIMPLGLELHLQVPGSHNVANALAAIAVCSRLGVSFKHASDALADFPGVARRFEYVGLMSNGVPVVDDYGHHPTEILASIEAARVHYPGYRIILIHEPHQAGRLNKLMDRTASALHKADAVILLPVYQVHGREIESDITEATSEILARKASELGTRIVVVKDYEQAVEKAKELISGKTLIITMGATDVWKVGKLLVASKNDS